MKLLYFAWIRERMGIPSETVSPPDSVLTVNDLLLWLSERSNSHAEALKDLSSIRVAVNQEYASSDSPVKAGDEVALFPPVTGG